jgi:DNA-binding LacI/PurR family transcriptional regulator
MPQLSRAKPKIGILLGGYSSIALTGCYKILFDYFAEMATRSRCSLEILGQVGLTKGAHVPWENEPIEWDRLSPGPLPEKVRAHRFDGLLAMRISSPQYLAEFSNMGLPLVVLDFQPIGVNSDSVVFDGIEAGSQIGRHLAATGHRNILFASLFNRDLTARTGADEFIEDDASVDRRTGILTGIEKSKCTLWPCLPFRNSESDDDLKNRISRILKSANHIPDALSGHDIDYVGRVAAIFEQLGVKSPSQLSLLSVGSDPPFTDQAQKISHLQYSWRDMAVASWDLLWSRMTDNQMRGAPARFVKLPGRFIDRGSVLDRR